MENHLSFYVVFIFLYHRKIQNIVQNQWYYVFHHNNICRIIIKKEWISFFLALYLLDNVESWGCKQLGTIGSKPFCIIHRKKIKYSSFSKTFNHESVWKRDFVENLMVCDFCDLRDKGVRVRILKVVHCRWWEWGGPWARAFIGQKESWSVCDVFV